MFHSVAVYWNNDLYLASGTSKYVTEFVVYTYIFKTHLCHHCMGISIKFYYLPYRITNIKNNIFNN